MAEDVLNCFTTLLESIPNWIAGLESIVKSATERQHDILRENQPVDLKEDQTEKAKSKSSSVRTKQSQASQNGKEQILKSQEAEVAEGTLLRPQLPHMTQSDALRLAQRKRKTVSVCSDRQSGPLKYRSRSMVVVYYDGEVQRSFETTVRSIGTSRIALRKAQNIASVDRRVKTGVEANNEQTGTGFVPNMTFRSARQSPAKRNGDGSEVFEKIDGYLEKAQALCERAAHQVLRDGDCGLEIKNAKEHFTDAQKLGETELPTWRERAEKAAERQRSSEDRKRIEEQKEEQKPPPDYPSSEKLVGVDSFSSPEKLEVDLEADSDVDEGQDFALDHIKLTRPCFRSSKLAAH